AGRLGAPDFRLTVGQELAPDSVAQVESIQGRGAVEAGHADVDDRHPARVELARLLAQVLTEDVTVLLRIDWAVRGDGQGDAVLVVDQDGGEVDEPLQRTLLQLLERLDPGDRVV